MGVWLTKTSLGVLPCLLLSLLSKYAGGDVGRRPSLVLRRVLSWMLVQGSRSLSVLRIRLPRIRVLSPGVRKLPDREAQQSQPHVSGVPQMRVCVSHFSRHWEFVTNNGLLLHDVVVVAARVIGGIAAYGAVWMIF